ncbi:MAG TPA: RDD family protein [Blastocatellia bacterium]|nr:RDD family protein [Blastocatellia bacterium]
MQIHVRRGYGADGPYSLEQLQDMLDGGAVTFDDIVWVEGTEGWIPLNEVEGIYLRPAPEFVGALVEEGPQARPWVRYWARSIDIALICIIVGIPVGAVLQDELNNRLVDQLIQFLALTLWIPIEAALIATFGCTPGKALLRVRVSNKNGSNLSFGQALSRSFGVWLKGLGTGLIPFVTLVTCLAAHNRLSKKGVTTWDRDGRFQVTHRKVGIVRTLIAIAIYAVIIAAAFAAVMDRQALDGAPK